MRELTLLLLALAGCASAGIREEALSADPRLSPTLGARLLARAWERLDEGKRIFDLRVSDRVRVLNGEGALVYETRPLRLRLDVFGPHATPVLALAQDGDSVTVLLYEDRRFVAGVAGDPQLAALTEGRGFTGHEVLGALLGAYDPSSLVRGPADTVAYASGDAWVVALLEPERAHRFTYARSDSTLREYRQDRGRRPAYRVRFSDLREADGRASPFRVELQDVAERRTLRVTVRKETDEADLPPDAYRLEPF